MFGKPSESGSKVYRDALSAYTEGRWIYAPALTGLKVPTHGWSNEIGEIESAGWRLEHWAVFTSGAGVVVAAPVFRRRT